MRKIIQRLRVRSQEGGAVLPFVALMLVVLMGMAAFAVDLGWLYLQGSRIQRAADASALAGVVHLPGNTVQVDTQTVNGANANGWNVGELNGDDIGSGPDSLAWSPMAENRLHVELTSTVPTFFMRVFGIREVTMTRQATAEYVKPVPMGSPANCFGMGPINPPLSATAGLPSGDPQNSLAKCRQFTQNFWAAINGPRTALENGDPFAVLCVSGATCATPNPDLDPYYYYAIDMPAGKTFLDVYLYDAGSYHRDLFAEAGDFHNLVDSLGGGTNMRFQLFRPQNPTDPTNNLVPVTCSSGTNDLSINSGASSTTYRNRWERMCRINSPTAGMYVLRVNNGTAAIGGTNSYSILAHTNGVNATSTVFPRVYAINYMGIFANANAATLYLAEVPPVHAGKTLELRFFDPGEGSGNANMTITSPPGVGAATCVWTATNGQTGNTCTIATTVSGVAQFNSHWITMQIALPQATSYNCTSDCFWRVTLNLNTPHDRTTWTARVIGNPVRLVPN